MGAKKLVSKIGHNLLAHWISSGILAAMSIGLPYWTVVVEHWSWPLAISLGIVLFAAGLSIYHNLFPSEAFADDAELNLHYYGDERVPERISYNNIWRWYSMRNMFIGIDGKGDEKKIGVITNLVVSFDTPVKVGTLTVRSVDFQMPQHEVKEFNSRFALIAFTGEIPAGMLNIVVKQ